tara:strand:+ start:1814 stop:2623 length:810 start_codon:yes stop_codon:yes gene_type:complete
MAKAVTVTDALVAMRDCDDSIMEIDAMIPRLLTMKKQLKAQKEYIEVAIKDANDSDNTNANTRLKDDTNGGAGALIVDFRVKLFKHQQKIQRLASNLTTNGTLAANITIDSTVEPNSDDNRAVKNGGGGGAIFTSAQTSTTDIQEKQTNSVFDGVDLNGTKKFLIGVNALLTQANDVSTNTSGATEAIIPINVNNTDKGKFSTDYSPGGIHKINEEVLRGLLLLGNNGETGDKSLATNDGIAITEVKNSNVPTPTFADRGKKIRGFGLS